ncbi:MAG: hypothetical protein QOG54_1905 [Actinomycetota bacterium]|jgi:hypothetical protein|nr:hypothetical protein [Actinomycetota bacterium]
MRRAGSLFALVLLLASACFGSVPALAHQELPLHALPVISSVQPEVDGLEFRVLQLTAPALVVENTTNEPILVNDQTGSPFLEVGPNGVKANANSAFTYLSFDPDGRSSMGAVLGAKGKPRWVTLSRESTWTWFDPRIRYNANDLDWSVDGEFKGAPVLVTGTYEPLQGHGHFVSRLDAPPSASGLDVRLVEGPVPGIFARNTSEETLSIPGRSGEPFLRIGPKGVLANMASPSWYLGGSQAIGRVPRFAHAGAAPRWKRVSTSPVWGWLEYRAALPAGMQIRGELGAEPGDILEWSTPMTLGDEEITLTGAVRWVPAKITRAPARAPARSGSTTVPWSLLLASTGVLVVVGNALRLRRRPSDAPSEA